MKIFVNYTNFYKPLFLLLALFFWFNFLLPSASAIPYGCLKTDGECETVDVGSFGQAREKCVQDYGEGTRSLLDGCNNFGCVAPDGTCVSVSAVDGVEGRAICDNFAGLGYTFSSLSCDKRETNWGCIKPDGACVNIKGVDPAAASRQCESQYGREASLQLESCDVEKNYACFRKDEKDCVVVRANTMQSASNICKGRCSGTSLNCYIDFEQIGFEGSVCPVSLGDKEISKLQQSAYSNLNRAGLNNPGDLVKRFINLLMAFIGSLTLVLYVYAGVLWLTARGESDHIDKAKKIMVWTTLGVAVMLFSYMLVSFLFSTVTK